MSLFPKDDVLAREIGSWQAFADSLRADDRELFERMLNECFRHAAAVNAKGELFPTESLLMALVLSQQKMIDWLVSVVEKKP